MTEYSLAAGETLVEALYLAGGDPDNWRGFLKQALKTFNVQLALLVLADTANPHILFEVERRETISDDAVRAHIDTVLACITHGQDRHESHVLTLVVPGARPFGLSLVRDPARPAFTIQGRSGLASLRPFVRQVLRLPLRRATATADTRYLEALDRIAMPCVLLDFDRRILFSNVAARQALGSCLSPQPDGRFRLTDKDAQAAVERALERFRGGQNAGPVDVAIRLPESRPLLAVMMPTGADPGRRVAAAIYFIESDMRLMPGASAARLCAVYGMTAAEADIALLLLSGSTASQIAIRRRVSLHTVRAQIKQVFDKTRSHNQAGLFKLFGFFNV